MRNLTHTRRSAEKSFGKRAEIFTSEIETALFFVF